MKTYDEIARRVLARRDEYKEKQKIKRQSVIQISTAVICLAVVTVTYLTAVRRNWLKIQFEEFVSFQAAIKEIGGSQTGSDNTTKAQATTYVTSPTIITDFPYVTTTEISYELDWERKSMPGKFSTLAVKGTQNLNAIDESEVVGGCVERGYVYPFEAFSETATTRPATLLLTDKYIAGYEPNGTRHTTLVDVFSLDGLSDDLVLGVSFHDDDRIYAYVYNYYVPETLGEFLQAVDYDNTVTYGSIKLFSGTNFPVNDENAKDIKSYLLSDISLANIMDADAEPTGECVSISISCHELGKSDKTLNIYEDGYITTNLIGYEYTFYVGKEPVADFLKNSYNITFEEIKAQNQSEEKQTTTTSPTTEPITSSAVTHINGTEVTDTTSLVTESDEEMVTTADSTANTSGTETE